MLKFLLIMVCRLPGQLNVNSSHINLVSFAIWVLLQNEHIINVSEYIIQYFIRSQTLIIII